MIEEPQKVIYDYDDDQEHRYNRYGVAMRGSHYNNCEWNTGVINCVYVRSPETGEIIRGSFNAINPWLDAKNKKVGYIFTSRRNDKTFVDSYGRTLYYPENDTLCETLVCVDVIPHYIDLIYCISFNYNSSALTLPEDAPQIAKRYKKNNNIKDNDKYSAEKNHYDNNGDAIVLYDTTGAYKSLFSNEIVGTDGAICTDNVFYLDDIDCVTIKRLKKMIMTGASRSINDLVYALEHERPPQPFDDRTSDAADYARAVSLLTLDKVKVTENDFVNTDHMVAYKGIYIFANQMKVEPDQTKKAEMMKQFNEMIPVIECLNNVVNIWREAMQSYVEENKGKPLFPIKNVPLTSRKIKSAARRSGLPAAMIDAILSGVPANDVLC